MKLSLLLFFPFTFSDVFSTGSAVFSTDVEACDLFSQVDVDSDDAGCEDKSSSLTMVDEDRSGEETPEVVTGFCAVLGFAGTGAAGARFSRELCGFSVFSVAVSSASASSAQLGTEPRDAVEGVTLVSFAGVVVPEEGLLGVAGDEVELERPFAACA